MIARLIVNRLAKRGDGGWELPSIAEVREYLSPPLSELYSFKRLPDVAKAAEILAGKIRDGSRIMVIGDYDIDGVCAAYILTDGLRMAGGDALHAIPSRTVDGYGLSERLVRQARDSGASCIVTCDNGISAAEQVALAGSFGMNVVVTDHHEVPFREEGGRKTEILPPADAIVDPKRAGSGYAFPDICGAVVAFKVLAALYSYMGLPLKGLEKYEGFAAFATVGDVMPLRGENRSIVAGGLRKLRKGDSIGMRSLIKLQGLEEADIEPYHVGFMLGPCINAAGRLADADTAYRLLASRSYAEALGIAEKLSDLNEERKKLTDAGTEEALAAASGMAGDRVLVIHLPNAHESVAGIIAGRVREKTGKPTFVVTGGDGHMKGSGRSIPEYDMYGAMCAVSDVFSKFGGHRLAGGFSLKDGICPSEMSRRLNAICRLTDRDVASKVYFDMQLPFSLVDSTLISSIAGLGPFGEGNEKPLFAAGGVTASGVSVLGKNRNAARCVLTDGSRASMQAVYFGDADVFAERASRGPLKVLFYPEINEFGGKRALQLRIKNYS